VAGLGDLDLTAVDQAPSGTARRLHELAPGVLVAHRPGGVGRADGGRTGASAQQLEDGALEPAIHVGDTAIGHVVQCAGRDLALTSGVRA
jgi:hypothetical protein